MTPTQPQRGLVPFVAPDLPDEVCWTIAENADRETALKLRFMGDAFAWGAAKVLFRTVTMSMSVGNTGRLFKLFRSNKALMIRSLTLRAPRDSHGVHPANVSDQEIRIIGNAVTRLSRLEEIALHLNLNVLVTMQSSPDTANIISSILQSASRMRSAPKLTLHANGIYDINGDPENWGSINNFQSGYLSRFRDIELNVGKLSSIFGDSLVLSDFIDRSCQNVVTLQLGG